MCSAAQYWKAWQPKQTFVADPICNLADAELVAVTSKITERNKETVTTIVRYQEERAKV